MRINVLLLSIIFAFVFNSNLLAQDTKLGAVPSWTKGNQNAKVKIEVFNDYQCPTCVVFNGKLKIVEGKFPNDLQIIFRHFPLVHIHLNAMLAAQAVEAAGMQGKFREISDLIFERQRMWTHKKLAKNAFIYYARKLRLNIRKFKSDLDSQQAKDRINADVERGKYLKLKGTPTVFLNGKELSFVEWDNLERIIKENLSK
jgi:protein-disulfide isomerase